MNIKKIAQSMCAVILATSSLVSSVNAVAVGPGDWSHVRLYGMGYPQYNEPYTASNYWFIKNFYQMFCMEKSVGRNVYDWTEVGSLVSSAQIKANNPNADILYYWNALVSYDNLYYSLNNKIRNSPSWKDSNGHFNYQPGFESFWTNNCNAWNNASAWDGVFVDAVGATAVVKPYNMDKLHTMMDNLNGGPIIYNGYYVSGSTTYAGAETLAHADGVFIEGFFGFLNDTLTEGVTMMENLLALPSDKYLVCNGIGGSFWGNNFRFHLACYLIVANDNSYFRYGSDWTTGSFEWRPEYNKRLGPPLGRAVRNGYLFTRSFQYCDVAVNLSTKQFMLNWK